MTDIHEILKKQPILLIDGDCVLCNNSINYVLDREKKPMLSFATLTSETGKALIEYFELPDN